MAFTATLDGIEKTANPGTLTAHVIYRDSDNPDWSPRRDIPISLAVVTTQDQLQQAIIAAIRADASPFYKQIQAYPLAVGLIGQTLTITQ